MTDDYQGRPGQVARHQSGSRAVLSHRKTDGSGWWIRGGGGLDDHALAADDWELLDEFETTRARDRTTDA